MTAGRLGRKQRVSHEDFVEALARIEATVSREALARTCDQTVEEIRRVTRGKRVAFGWSGGKDSIALRYVCEWAGVTDCVLVISELEYPAFLQWATDEMPHGLTVVNTGQDLEWLSAHPEMLFPANATIAGKWFKAVQHTGQERYYKREKLDMLIVGRRIADGNFVGEEGQYTSHGITRYSPIRHWSHEDVLAICHYEKASLPPCYGWPRGYRVGTGPWAARQWTRDHRHGWEEIYTIDSGIVRDAARLLPEARDFLQEVEGGCAVSSGL